MFYCRNDLEFGPAVAKGCNAVVYSARWTSGPEISAGHSEESSVQAANVDLSKLNGLEQGMSLMSVASEAEASPPTSTNTADSDGRKSRGQPRRKSSLDVRPRSKSESRLGGDNVRLFVKLAFCKP